MTIAVSIDGVGYDASELLANEQRRISGFLQFASPRDINDLSQIVKYAVPSGTTTIVGDKDTAGNSQSITLTAAAQFNTYIRASYSTTGQAVYGVYFRDDGGVEHFLSGGSGTGNHQVVAPGDVNTASKAGQYALLPDGTVQQIQYGDILQNATGTATTPGGGPTATIVGRVKFEAESGLALASINTRMSDINNVIETLAKVLSIQSDMFNAASGIVR